MKRLPLILAAALLLPSCEWNIGENILTAAETRVALDYYRPLEGKIYRVGAPGGKARYYARLQEVRYHMMPDIVRGVDYGGGYRSDYFRCGTEPTGRVAVAELEVDFCGYREVSPHISVPYRSKEPVGINGVRCEVATLPAGAVAVPFKPRAAEDAELAGMLEPDSSPGPLRRAAATTCSYTLDPLLTFTTSLVCCTGFAIVSAVTLPIAQVEQWDELDESVQVQGADVKKRTDTN